MLLRRRHFVQGPTVKGIVAALPHCAATWAGTLAFSNTMATTDQLLSVTEASVTLEYPRRCHAVSAGY